MLLQFFDHSYQYVSVFYHLMSEDHSVKLTAYSGPMKIKYMQLKITGINSTAYGINV